MNQAIPTRQKGFRIMQTSDGGVSVRRATASVCGYDFVQS